MAFTFLKAQGHAIGGSLVEEDQLETVRGYLRSAEVQGVDIVVPSDIVMAAEFAPDAEHAVASTTALEQTTLGPSALGLDIGPETAEAFASRIVSSNTVFWNGRFRDSRVREGHGTGRESTCRDGSIHSRRRRRLSRRRSHTRIRR